MDRRSFLTSLMAFPTTGRIAMAQTLPDVPQDKDRIARTFAYYNDHARDFVMFKYTTCCLVASGQTDADAIAEAKGILDKIISFHPDFRTYWMDDGHFMVGYNHPAYNVLLFDDDGSGKPDQLKLGLLGRSLMFRDADAQIPDRVVRASS